MFDWHLNRQTWLSYFVRGPERAFVVVQDDFDGLLDVAAICSKTWNGAGALIVPVNDRGSLGGDWERHWKIRVPEQVWLHPRLSAVQVESVLEQWPTALSWDDLTQVRELHPVSLIPAPETGFARPVLSVPSFGSVSMRRIAACAYGVLEDHWVWRHRCDVNDVANEKEALIALVEGQVGSSTTCPLLLAQANMRIVSASDREDRPYVWVFKHDNFDDIVAFWNFRARTGAGTWGASVVGIPEEALAYTAAVMPLHHWVMSSTAFDRYPQFLVHASPEILEDLAKRFAKARFEQAQEPQPFHSAVDEYMGMSSWAPAELRYPKRIVRGAAGMTTLSVRDGHGIVSVTAPTGFVWRPPLGVVRVVLNGLQAPLPLTPQAAQRMSTGFSADDDGPLVQMMTGPPWRFDLALPDATTALEDWAAHHGFDVAESRPSADARALLERLGGVDRLDVIADEIRISVLRDLTPPSGKEQLLRQLARHYGSEPRGDELLEELTHELRDLELFIRLRARTIEQLQSALPGNPNRREVLRAIEALVDVGLVHRGRQVACPTCRFEAFLLLRELDEHVRCRACGAPFLLAVSEGNYGHEPLLAYSVDGLMARAVQQGVLPVLLAMRALSRSVGSQLFSWPGVLFNHADTQIDVDLLASDGCRVWAVECKVDARGLGDEQLQKLLELSGQLNAIPVIAALAGPVADSLRDRIEAVDGLVLERSDLLRAPTPERR